MNTVAVMFSGGIDSTYMLWQYLLKKEDSIHVHHIEIKTDQPRWGAENQATKKILEYLRKNVSTDFEFTTTVYDFRGLGRIPLDLEIVLSTTHD